MMFKKWYKSKTQIFNGLLVVIGLIEANTGEFRELLGDHFGSFIVIIGAIGWYLRTKTSKSLQDK